MTTVTASITVFARWTGGQGNIPVTGVTLSDDTSIAAGSSKALTAGVIPTNATNQAISWSSSNNAVATVLNGVVTGVSEGKAVITVTTADGGFTKDCVVTVTPTVRVTGVSLGETTLSIAVNAAKTLTATVLPANAANKNVRWESSNSAVATVSSTGEVRGVKEGTAVITVTTADGPFTATCTVTVDNSGFAGADPGW